MTMRLPNLSTTAFALFLSSTALAQDANTDRMAVDAVDEEVRLAFDEAVRLASESSGDLGQGVVYCGGETTREVIDAYFADLRSALAEGREPAYFNRFFGERFRTIRENRVLDFNRADFNSVTPHSFAMEDWRAIAARGPEALSPVGYRGCDMEHGKVWFSGQGDEFLLYTINHDLSWEPQD